MTCTVCVFALDFAQASRAADTIRTAYYTASPEVIKVIFVQLFLRDKLTWAGQNGMQCVDRERLSCCHAAYGSLSVAKASWVGHRCGFFAVVMNE